MKKILATTLSIALLGTGIVTAPQALAYTGTNTGVACTITVSADDVAKIKASRDKFIEIAAEEYEKIAPGSEGFITRYLQTIATGENQLTEPSDYAQMIAIVGTAPDEVEEKLGLDIDPLAELKSMFPAFAEKLDGTAEKIINALVLFGIIEKPANINIGDLGALSGAMGRVTGFLNHKTTDAGALFLDDGDIKGFDKARAVEEAAYVNIAASDAFKPGLKKAFDESNVYEFIDGLESAKNQCAGKEDEEFVPEGPKDETKPGDTDKQDTKEGSSESTGVIIGIVVAVVALLGALGAAAPYILPMLNLG